MTIIIEDSNDKVIGYWSKFHMSKSESCALLLSLQMTLQNIHKTVYLEEDTKNVIKALM